jgi:phytoene dehydrogenase-like protein
VAEEIDRRGVPTGNATEHCGADVVCNMDPRRAAEMIGLGNFSRSVRRKLDYDYSPSNFMAYCVVDGLDLRDHGFGRWNLFHTDHPDLNQVFHDMLRRGDYSRPSFAVTTPGLLTEIKGDCPEGQQIIEFLTVADYARFRDLKFSDPRAYRAKKQEVFDAILDVMERDYVPGLREHLVFSMTGSPTTNERFCWSPAGHSYGSNMTPENIGPGRLDHRTSLAHFHFCNASSGYAGFAGTIWTGCRLYEKLGGGSLG